MVVGASGKVVLAVARVWCPGSSSGVVCWQ